MNKQAKTELWDRAVIELGKLTANKANPTEIHQLCEAYLLRTIEMVKPDFQPYMWVTKNIGGSMNPNKLGKKMATWFDHECKA
jgi:hypothetical protein